MQYYNNKVFYFDSMKYDPKYYNSYYPYYPKENIQNIPIKNFQNIPIKNFQNIQKNNNTTILLNITNHTNNIPFKQKIKKVKPAGKGYVAARYLKN